MRTIFCCGCLTIAVAFMNRAAVAQTPGAQSDRKAAHPAFVIYSPEEDAAVASSLLRVLRASDGKPTRIAKAESIRAASESDANVVILVMTRLSKVPEIEKDVLVALKRRKIIGIGSGAAQVFGRLGLEINSGNLVHGLVPPASLQLTKSVLLGKPSAKEPIPLFTENADAIELETREAEFCAMFAHPRGKDAAIVDVIARWAQDPNYAPVVRQGNCILIGIPAPATVWSAPYSELVGKACFALCDRDLEPFTVAHRALSKPGSYEFKLAKRDSPDEPFDRAFFFRFTEPKKLTIHLTHSGSSSICLFFAGDHHEFIRGVRKDARNGEPLEISVEITREDIEAIGDRCWCVSAYNHDDGSPADCKLTIAADAP